MGYFTMTSGGLIVDDGLKIMLNRTYKDTPDYEEPTVFKVGTGTTTAAGTDTDLESPVAITGTETIDDCEATTGWAAGTDTAIATNAVTFKEGTKSLSVAKTGTAGTVFSMDKTTTSLDFTSKELFVWVFITDLTDLVTSGTAVTVRFGSDSGNYYEFDVAIGSLAAGWNSITFNTTTASSTTGSPTITACDYTYISFNTDLAADTVAADRVMVDDFKLASADDFIKTFESGFPTLDESTHEATTRCRVLSTQANGYDLAEFGTFNEDGTPLMFSRDVFTAISKSNTEEILFIAVDKIKRE